MAKSPRLVDSHPHLLSEWDYNKNKHINLDKVLSGSAKVASWICSVCGNNWETPIRSRAQRKTGCPKCAIIKGSEKRRISLLSKTGCINDPLLLAEWDYDKNQGLKPTDFSPHSNKSVFWRCSKCNYSWKAKISNRESNRRGCPLCANQVVVRGVNDLATKKPELAAEWHPTKNQPLTPYEVSIGTRKKVWWLCPLGHEYEASILHRGRGTSCPVCHSGRQTSFAEQAIFYYAKKHFPDSLNRCTDIIGNRMELDIYIPSLRVAIEYDGAFYHIKKNGKDREKTKFKLCRENGITLWRVREDEPNSNLLKCSAPLIIRGNAHKYLDVDSDMVFYADKSGNNSNLEENIFHIINCLYKRKTIIASSRENFMPRQIDINITRDEHKIREQYTQHIKSKSIASLFPNIAKEWHPTKNGALTPDMYTKGSDFKAFWLCSSCGNEWRTSISHRVTGTGCPKCYDKTRKEEHVLAKPIYQYSLGGEYVRSWKSISIAARELNINNSNISMCAQGKRPNAGGYRWNYEKLDSLPLIQKQKKSRKGLNEKPIIQFDLEGKIINEFVSLNEAGRKTGINPTSISKVLHGHTKKAGGYYWKKK